MRIADVLEELGVPFAEGGSHHHVSQNWVGLDCPSCSPDSSKWKLGVPADGPAFATCWTCGPQNLARALAEVSGRPLGEVLRLLGGLEGRRAPREERPRGKLVLPSGVGPLLPAHRRYLRGRGLDPAAVARLWGVGGIGIAPRLSWRLFVPVTHRGRTVSWTTRSIADKGRRYHGASPAEEELPAKSVLYGADLARGAIVVVEGPADCWAVGPGAVATLGVSYTRAQLLAMSRYPVRAVCFDAEPEARRRARRLAADLSAFPGVTEVAELETGKDASRASPAEVAELRKRFLE